MDGDTGAADERPDRTEIPEIVPEIAEIMNGDTGAADERSDTPAAAGGDAADEDGDTGDTGDTVVIGDIGDTAR